MDKQQKDLSRPIGQPLQVYLDSSDYSLLGDALEDSAHQHAATLARLIELVDSGRIEIRYSGIHVVEVSHTEKAVRDAGVRRAKCIERLSGGKCFIFWTSMFAQEQENFAGGCPLYGGLTSDDGSWFPDIGDLARSFRSSMTEGIRKALKENVNNRHDRRAAEKMFIKNNKLTELAASKLLVPQRATLLRTLEEQFPLSERFFKEDLIIRFAIGQLPAAELLRELSVVFRNIEKFIGWTYDTRDTERKTVKWFRELGAQLKNNVENMRKLFEPFVGVVPSVQIKNTLELMVEERTPELRRKFITGIAEKPDGAPIGELGDLPALDAYVRALGLYVKMSIRGDRNLLPSDSGDLMHLTHGPYCDVFRADGYTSQIASQVLKPYGTKVVPKLAQLIGVLNSML
jgi:hypothetical protein